MVSNFFFCLDRDNFNATSGIAPFSVISMFRAVVMFMLVVMTMFMLVVVMMVVFVVMTMVMMMVSASVAMTNVSLRLLAGQLQEEASNYTVNGKNDQVTDEDQHKSQWKWALNLAFFRPFFVQFNSFWNNVY